MKTTLKIGITVLLIGAIVWGLGGLREVGVQILRIDPLYVIPILLLFLFDRGLMTFKWGLLLRGRGIRLPFFRGMMIYCASAVWGLFLPSTVGADAVRAYCTSRTGIDSREIVASIIVERFLGFLSALLLAILSIILLTHLGILHHQILFIWLLGGGMLLGGILLFAATVSQSAFVFLHDRVLSGFRHNRIALKLREFHETYRSFTIDRRNIATFFGLTFAEQLVPIFDSWLIAKGLGIDAGLLYFAAALPLALLISRIPISIDGLGVFDGVFIVLMSMAGLSAAQAAAIAILGRILQAAALIPWWVAFVISHRNLRAPQPLGVESRSGLG